MVIVCFHHCTLGAVGFVFLQQSQRHHGERQAGPPLGSLCPSSLQGMADTREEVTSLSHLPFTTRASNCLPSQEGTDLSHGFSRCHYCLNTLSQASQRRMNLWRLQQLSIHQLFIEHLLCAWCHSALQQHQREGDSHFYCEVVTTREVCFSHFTISVLLHNGTPAGVCPSVSGTTD